MYSETKQALIQALREYYEQAVDDEYNEYNQLEEEELDEDEEIGMVVHYPVDDILAKAKKLSFLRAKYVVSDGKPIETLAITDDEDDQMIDWIKEGMTEIFREFTSICKKILNANPVETDITPTVYVAQVSFLKDEMWLASDKLFRCMVDTSEIPSEDSLDWLYISDAEPDRVYLFMLLNEYWDKNMADSLDQNVFMAIVAYLLKEWYDVTGFEQERVKWVAKYENYLKNAKGATYRRVKEITTTMQPI